jgi:hypothetical protein
LLKGFYTLIAALFIWGANIDKNEKRPAKFLNRQGATTSHSFAD